MSDAVRKHGSDHGPYGTDPQRHAPYHYVIRKVTQPIQILSPAAVFHVTRNMDGFRLVDVEAGMYLPGDDLEITVDNLTTSVGMLATHCTVAAGDTHSSESDGEGIPYTDDRGLVAHGDMLAINVVAGGGDARGLEVVLIFI